MSSLAEVLCDLVRDPLRNFVMHWNWKSAVLSSLVRSCLFFAANLSAGFNPAVAAFTTELVFRGATAGFYGALTQVLRDVRPAWHGTLAAMVLLPLCTHSLEVVVHYLRGTERLVASIILSVAFTALSTAFNLYAMRRGALLVGHGRESLWSDLRRLPRLIADFTTDMFRVLLGFA